MTASSLSRFPRSLSKLQQIRSAIPQYWQKRDGAAYVLMLVIFHTHQVYLYNHVYFPCVLSFVSTRYNRVLYFSDLFICAFCSLRVSHTFVIRSKGKNHAKRYMGTHDSPGRRSNCSEPLAVQGRKIIRVGEGVGRKNPRMLEQWDSIDPIPGMASMAPMTLRL
jgi:hypothetical protein